MQLTTVRFERLFGLGQIGGNGLHETLKISMDWNMEPGDTIERAEEQMADVMYAIAERERKRRWGLAEKIRNADRARRQQQEVEQTKGQTAKA